MNQERVAVIDLVPGKVVPIEIIPAEKLTPEVFWNEFVANWRPIVIKNAAATWPALNKWRSLHYLAEISRGVRVGYSRTFNALGLSTYLDDMLPADLSEVLREMESSSDDEVYSIPTIRVPLSWAKDVGRHSFLKNSGRARAYPGERLFVYKNACTEWHYHWIDETLTTQLRGRKRLSLFRLRPEQWSRYSSVLESNLHHARCGRRFFPSDDVLTKYEGTIEAGDTAYIPPLVWHGIDPADSEVGITHAYCFASPWKKTASLGDSFFARSWISLLRTNALRSLEICGLAVLGDIARRISGEDRFEGW